MHQTEEILRKFGFRGADLKRIRTFREYRLVRKPKDLSMRFTHIDLEARLNRLFEVFSSFGVSKKQIISLIAKQPSFLYLRKNVKDNILGVAEYFGVEPQAFVKKHLRVSSFFYKTKEIVARDLEAKARILGTSVERIKKRMYNNTMLLLIAPHVIEKHARELAKSFDLSYQKVCDTYVEAPSLMTYLPSTLKARQKEIALAFGVAEKSVPLSICYSSLKRLKQVHHLYSVMYKKGFVRLKDEDKISSQEEGLQRLTQTLLSSYPLLNASKEAIHLRFLYGMYLKEVKHERVSVFRTSSAKIKTALRVAPSSFVARHKWARHLFQGILPPEKQR